MRPTPRAPGGHAGDARRGGQATPPLDRRGRRGKARRVRALDRRPAAVRDGLGRLRHERVRHVGHVTGRLAEYRLDPSIALDASGSRASPTGSTATPGARDQRRRPRRDLQRPDLVDGHDEHVVLDTRPSIAIDAAGRSHVLFSPNAVLICGTRSACCAGPPLLVGHAGFGAVRRVTDNTDDTLPVVVRGLDGASRAHLPTSTGASRRSASSAPCPRRRAGRAPRGAGTTLAQKTAALSVGLGVRRHGVSPAAGVNGGAFANVGSVSGSTTRPDRRPRLVHDPAPARHPVRPRWPGRQRRGRRHVPGLGQERRAQLGAHLRGQMVTTKAPSYYGGKVRRATPPRPARPTGSRGE